MRNANAVGQTPTPLATSFTARRATMTPAPDTRAGAEMSVPAWRKKNGVKRAKAIERIRSMTTRSCMNTPARTSPPR
jgi:hypothetical protein